MLPILNRRAADRSRCWASATPTSGSPGTAQESKRATRNASIPRGAQLPAHRAGGRRAGRRLGHRRARGRRAAGLRHPRWHDVRSRLGQAFVEAARRVGLESIGPEPWDPEARTYHELAARIARATPDAVFLAGNGPSNGGRLLRDLRGALGKGVGLYAPDGFSLATELVEGAGERAEGLTVTLSAAASSALPRRGREWAAEFTRRYGSRPCCYAVHAAQVTELVLDAIERSDGTRAGVLDKLMHTRTSDGLVGDFSFDALGDSTLRGSRSTASRAVAFATCAPSRCRRRCSPGDRPELQGFYRTLARVDRAVTGPGELMATNRHPSGWQTREARLLRHITYKSIAAGAITMALAAGPGGVAAAAPSQPLATCEALTPWTPTCARWRARRTTGTASAGTTPRSAGRPSSAACSPSAEAPQS